MSSVTLNDDSHDGCYALKNCKPTLGCWLKTYQVPLQWVLAIRNPVSLCGKPFLSLSLSLNPCFPEEIVPGGNMFRISSFCTFSVLECNQCLLCHVNGRYSCNPSFQAEDFQDSTAEVLTPCRARLHTFLKICDPSVRAEALVTLLLCDH